MSYTGAGSDFETFPIERFRRSRAWVAVPLRAIVSRHGADRVALLLALWCVPASIAAAQSFLSIGLVVRIVKLLGGQARLKWSSSLWYWLLWAATAFTVWILSDQPAAGKSEMRHLALTGASFVAFQALDRKEDWRLAWQGIFVSSSLSSLLLIGEFFRWLALYRQEIHVGGDPAFYLRSGGLLHHWMVYGTVEIMVVAGLLAFGSVYRKRHRYWWLLATINGVAILLSLTRMVWLTCLILAVIVLLERRPKWVLMLPAAALALYLAGPAAVRSRISQSLDPTYYSNTERLQMLNVAWRMVRAHPMTGVGPGRIEDLYTSYLRPGESVPKYHGHLHNNVAQLAAEFGVPSVLAALLFAGILFRDLWKGRRSAAGDDERFISQAAFLAWIAFVFGGFFEYTYGHSLGVILICFAIVSAKQLASADRARRQNSSTDFVWVKMKRRPLIEGIVLVLLAGLFVVRAFIPGWRSLNTDFPNYYVAARLYQNSDSLSQVYDWTWFQRQKNHAGVERRLVTFIPLTLYSALPLAPISWLPPLEAKHYWLLTNLLLLAISAYFLSAMTRLGFLRVAVLFLLAVEPLRTHFLYGQVHILVLFLLTLSLWLYLRGWSATSGALIAAAGAIKLYPVLFAFYFIRKRQWRALAGLAASILILGGLALFLFGTEVNRVYLEQVLPRIAKGEGFDPYNLSWNSLTAVLYRLFIYEPQLNPHPLQNSAVAFAVFQPLFQMLLFAPILWLLTGKRETDDKERLEFATYTAALLVLSTNPASYHYTVLILTAVISADFLLSNRREGQAALFVVLYFLGCLSDRVTVNGVSHPLLQILFLPRLFLTLALYILLLYVLRSLRPAVPPKPQQIRQRFAIVSAMALIVALTAVSSSRHLRSEFANYAQRLTSQSATLLATHPAVTDNGFVFTKLQSPVYTIGVWDRDREIDVHTDVDLFHAAPISNSTEMFVEASGTKSRIIRIDWRKEVRPPSEDPTIVDNAEQPVLSPDGIWLAFLRETRGRAALWLKNLRADEGDEGAVGERELAGPEFDVLEAAFENDSSAIVFAAKPAGVPELFKVRVTSQKIIPLKAEKPARYPAFSPDGRWMAYSELERGNWQLRIQPLSSSEAPAQIPGECNSISPAWTRDSKWILFATDCGRGVGMTALARFGPLTP